MFYEGEFSLYAKDNVSCSGVDTIWRALLTLLPCPAFHAAKAKSGKRLLTGMLVVRCRSWKGRKAQYSRVVGQDRYLRRCVAAEPGSTLVRM